LLADIRSFLHRQNAVAAVQRTLIEAQTHHLRMQRIHERLRLVLDFGLAGLGIALLCGIGWMLYGAIADRSIVVNAFTVTPKLEAAGASGSNIAARFLDELIRLRDSTRADITARALINSLDEHVQLEVPEVHVSLGELRRVLHDTLGHRTNIWGDLAENPTGVVLTIRGKGLPPRSFAGKLEELPTLVTQAAEFVYGYGDPVPMVYYLQRANRLAEGEELVRTRYAASDAATQARLLNVWGNIEMSRPRSDRLEKALQKYRAAAALDPQFWYPTENMISFLAMGGREEEALQVGREFERTTRRDGVFGNIAGATAYEDLDALRMDIAGAIRAMRIEYDSSGGLGASGWASAPVIAYQYALQHDSANARLFLETNPVRPDDPIGGADSETDSEVALGTLEFDVGHYAQAAEHWDNWAKLAASAHLTYNEKLVPQRCWLPIVYEMAGRRADADAALAQVQKFHSIDCFRFRAAVFERRGDWSDAEATYREGVAHATSLPQVYSSWGKALLGAKRYPEAVEKLTAASQRGPHWADPLEYWGEALTAQGQYRAAIEKFAEAAKWAPNWGALYLHWAEAQEALGDRAGALQHLQRARSLSLADEDRQLLDRNLSIAAR